MADQREYHDSQIEALLTMVDALQARMWTSMPGIIESYDPATMTASVQISIQGKVQDNKGNWTDQTLPLLVDCPVKFPNGGGFSLTFPIQKGDECEVTFSSRCIDSWWQNGGVQPQFEYRVHDLSDGFVEVGPRSQPRVLSNISTNTVQLRNDAGDTYVEIDGSKNITLKSPSQVTVDAPLAHFTGDITAAGTITGQTDVVAGTVSGKTHTHGGVTTGAGNTGAPNP